MLLTVSALSFVFAWGLFWAFVLIPLLLLFPRLRGTDLSCFFARNYWGPAMYRVGRQRLILEGAENCPRDGPCVYLSNHQGIADIVMIYSLPVTLRFVAKAPIKYVPFLGWYMLADRHVFIDRHNRKDAVRSLRAAAGQIRSGINVVMFPEGTRTEDGRVRAFKKGPFRLALEAQVPIVPMALDGARDAWPRGKLWINASTLRLKVGKPIPTVGLTNNDRDALMAKVRSAIIELHRSIGGAGGDMADNVAPEGSQDEGPHDSAHEESVA
jgi:1-acyl-sn-glycerol-3-phosphate acyltransferase